MKPLLTYILLAAAIIIAAICAVNWYQEHKAKKQVQQEYSAYQESFNERSEIVSESNQYRIDSLKNDNAMLRGANARYQLAVDSLVKVIPAIHTKYKTIYNEISHTPDSGQLAITYRLLSAHQSSPLIRY